MVLKNCGSDFITMKKQSTYISWYKRKR